MALVCASNWTDWCWPITCRCIKSLALCCTWAVVAGRCQNTLGRGACIGPVVWFIWILIAAWETRSLSWIRERAWINSIAHIWRSAIRLSQSWVEAITNSASWSSTHWIKWIITPSCEPALIKASCWWSCETWAIPFFAGWLVIAVRSNCRRISTCRGIAC